MLCTPSQPEPSTKPPWMRTMLIVDAFMVPSLSQYPGKSPWSNALELKHILTLEVDSLFVKHIRADAFSMRIQPERRVGGGSCNSSETTAPRGGAPARPVRVSAR